MIDTTELSKVLQSNLLECTVEVIKCFDSYKLQIPRRLMLKDLSESFFVVAIKGEEALYYEDIEEGFNISKISPEGYILEHWCNQDSLNRAVRKWVEEDLKY
ncbi:MAG: hypothetical protein HQK66_12020 [Desulfamplus sp.]|nr:hypothetical protein [Desulfamplus sp.]